MYVIATFEQNLYFELAITALEQKGISKASLLAVPLDKRKEPKKMFDSIHRADGFSMLDLAAILGTCGMLLGSIYGFVLAWGPIIWGIIGAVSGLLAGFAIKFLILKKRNDGINRGPDAITAEIVLLIRCQEQQWETIEKILWDNMALGLSRIAEPAP
ncbi:MAG TPA: hypothetical protein VF260_01990 [Bacilli bacterium]